MIDQGKKNVLGILVNAMDYDAAVQQIISAAQQHMPFSVSALAVHGVMTGVNDSVHRYRLNSFDLIVPDGQPVRWAMNWLYRSGLPDRVYGPNLMLRICERAAEENIPIFLYGSKPVVVETLKKNLIAKYPTLRIVGIQPSGFKQVSRDEKLAIANKICQSGAALTFVGLGCPQQEVWVYEFLKLLSMPLVAIGAAFDFHAGLLPQAPVYLQNCGLEWLFRFMQEPYRLWKRYFLLNPQYLFLLFLQLLKIKSYDPADAIAPTHELRYS